jgi:hypothetical protein
MDYERIAIIIVGIAVVSGATLLISSMLSGGSQAQTYIINYAQGNATATGVATMLPGGSFKLDNGRLLDAAKDNVSVIKVLTPYGNISTCSCRKCEACPAPVNTCANATAINKTKETPSCLNNSRKCSADSSCCSGYCNATSGTCGTKPLCYGAGGKCGVSAVAANATGCCAGLFCNATSGLCQEKCKTTGIACGKDTSCCSGYCNTATKQCGEKNVSFQCTPSYCSNGVVYSGCHWDSDLGRCACDQSACDSQKCSSDGTTCAANTACTANGKNCSSSGACCSKYCNASSMTCKPYPNCQANHCEGGVLYRDCEFDFAFNTCGCSGESICATQRCNANGTACDAQACPASYCKDGALFNCTVSAASGACSCAQTVCRSQQCNADGWTCK